jgi:ubiquinone/menaquinone biosynthesis C-methylase UbiE
MEQRSQQPAAASPAEIYERHMVPAIFAPWVPALLELAALQPGERLLDVACGTGVVARHAVSQVAAKGRVVGLDINPTMLAMARAREPGVAWLQGNVVAMPFADHAFDVAVCQQGLQFFPDEGAALSEMHRVLVPGGLLALALWCEIESSPGHHALARGLAQHVGAAAAALMSAVFRLGAAETIRPLLEDARFSAVRIHREARVARFLSLEAFTRCVVVGSVLGRTGVQVADTALSAVIHEVEAALHPYVQADGLAFPMEAHLVVAQT